MPEPVIIPVESARPVNIDGKAVASFSIKPQTFLGYIEMVKAAGNAAGDFATNVWREWQMRNVTALDAAGNAVPFRLADLLQFPAVYAIRFRKHYADETDAAGNVIRDGDGLDEPCVYALGTPLALGSDEDAPKLVEIEFLIRLNGDIEAVMAASGSFDQAAALILNCGKPLVVGDATLLRIPDSVMAMLTYADGAEIARKVLPRFLS